MRVRRTCGSEGRGAACERRVDRRGETHLDERAHLRDADIVHDASVARAAPTHPGWHRATAPRRVIVGERRGGGRDRRASYVTPIGNRYSHSRVEINARGDAKHDVRMSAHKVDPVRRPVSSPLPSASSLNSILRTFPRPPLASSPPPSPRRFACCARRPPICNATVRSSPRWDGPSRNSSRTRASPRSPRAIETRRFVRTRPTVHRRAPAWRYPRRIPCDARSIPAARTPSRARAGFAPSRRRR